MSDVDDNDDFDGEGTAQSGGSGNAAKVLREQNSKLAKQLEEAQKALNTLQAAQRTTTIADVLREKQANPKLAKFIARDLEGDVTAESVEKWLAEEGELFGYAPPSAEDQEAATQQARISEASARAPQPDTGWTPEKLRSATTQQLIEAGFIQPD